jgi:hypothetical protein
MDRAPLAVEDREPHTRDAGHHLIHLVVDLLSDLAPHRDAHHHDLAVRDRWLTT